MYYELQNFHSHVDIPLADFRLTAFLCFSILFSICRVIHTDYGVNREMEFKHTKELFGPYNNDLYWSSTKGALIKEEKQLSKNQPKVCYTFIAGLELRVTYSIILIYNHKDYLLNLSEPHWVLLYHGSRR